MKFLCPTCNQWMSVHPGDGTELDHCWHCGAKVDPPK